MMGGTDGRLLAPLPTHAVELLPAPRAASANTEPMPP